MKPYYPLSDIRATKNPVFPVGYGLLGMLLDIEMVEAGGIEPRPAIG